MVDSSLTFEEGTHIHIIHFFVLNEWRFRNINFVQRVLNLW